MRRLDRYIFAEILGPLCLGFLIYTLILILRFLFDVAELIIRRGVPVETVTKLVLLYMPSIIVMTIPMALLFGILVAINRLSSESELIAIRSSGISLFFLYRPILTLSALLMLLNGYLMIEILPRGNHAWSMLNLEIRTQSMVQQIEPRIFYSEWEGRTFYVFEAPPGESRWKGTFLADSIPGRVDELTIAQWGAARVSEEAGAVMLSLEDARQHRVDFSNPDVYEVLTHQNLDLVIARGSPANEKKSVSRSLRELDLQELRQKARDTDQSELTRNLARVEVQKKFAIPAVCLVFGLLALPLGFTSNNRGGGRSSGFAVSIGVILVYWILLTFAEELAGEGRAPAWLAMWTPNVLFFLAGLFLLARRNRDKSLLLTRLDQWIREHLWSRLITFHGRRRAEKLARRELATRTRRARADLVLRLPTPQLRFPNAIDRYILTAFGKVLLLVALSGLTVYLVGDITERIDDVLKNDISKSVLFTYYKYKSLGILYEIAPILVLVSVLITFGLLSRSNEVTACKASGMSLYRLTVPVVLAAAMISGLCGLLQAEVLPASNERVVELEDVIRGREQTRVQRRADRRWLFGKEGYLYNYLHFDDKRERIQRLQILQFDGDYRLTQRLVANRADHQGDGSWILTNGWRRTFGEHGVEEFEKFSGQVRLQIPEDPSFFAGEERGPEEMSYSELKSYIEELERSGQSVPELKVELHGKLSYPATSLVMALVALPFSFLLGRRGALYGIGLAIVLAIVFMALMAAFTALGETAVLPAEVAVWAPSVIFSLFAMYMFLGVRT